MSCTCPCSEQNGGFTIVFFGDLLQHYPWPKPKRALYLPLAKSHVQFPLITSFQRISTSPWLCDIFRKAVSCQVVDFLATRPTIKLEDTPCRVSAAVYSIYYHLPSVSGEHLIHRNLKTRRTVLTWTHLVRLMMYYHYHYNYYYHLVFSLAVTELLKIFISPRDPNPIINALLTFSLLLTSYWHPVYH